MCLKQFLYIATATLLTSPTGYRLEVVSTTQQPAICHQDYQHKLLTALNEVNSQLLKFELGKCHEVEIFQKQQGSIEDIKKILENQTKSEDQLERITSLEKTVEKLVAQVENLKTAKILPRNCYEILKSGASVGGVYAIRPNNSPQAFTVRCNMDTMGGGWTYVLERHDGSQNFYLKWADYKKGFGDLKGEFFLGLQYLHELTGSEDNELLVEVVDWDNKKAYALYESFRLGNEAEGYPIQVLSGYSGDAGDSLGYHLKSKFSTNDHDNDNYTQNCAVNYNGAWWYKQCHVSHLTGTYFHYNADDPKGMTWNTFRNYHSLKEARMMIRYRNK